MATSNLNISNQPELNIDANFHPSHEIKFMMIHHPKDQTIEVQCTQDFDFQNLVAEKSFPAESSSGKLISQFMQEMVAKLLGNKFMPSTLQHWSYRCYQPTDSTQNVKSPQINTIVDSVMSNMMSNFQTPTPADGPMLETPPSHIVPNNTSENNVVPEFKGSFKCTAETFYDFFGPIFERFLYNSIQIETND